MNTRPRNQETKRGTTTLTISEIRENADTLAFCTEFVTASSRPRLVFGRNEYAESVASVVDVDGFIDDFTDETEYLGKPIVPLQEVPKDALVLSVVAGERPLVAMKRLNEHGLRSLDYFAFRRYANLDLKPVWFWDEFPVDFEEHRERYDWVFNKLRDEESRVIFQKIINFRLSSDLAFSDGFTDARHRQYFEDFLNLESEGEVFVDVGCFDGATSELFIEHCPDYAAIHVFEPEVENMSVVKQRLAVHARIHYHQLGLSDRAETLRFEAKGSSSRITEQGVTEIEVRRLDDVLREPFSFLKMDIEGEEMAALEGARSAIVEHHPRLAISVYHRYDDLWRIPERILSYRSDYDIYLRHYTEGITETVMFFLPRTGG